MCAFVCSHSLMHAQRGGLFAGQGSIWHQKPLMHLHSYQEQLGQTGTVAKLHKGKQPLVGWRERPDIPKLICSTSGNSHHSSCAVQAENSHQRQHSRVAEKQVDWIKFHSLCEPGQVSKSVYQFPHILNRDSNVNLKGLFWVLNKWTYKTLSGVLAHSKHYINVR